MRQLLIGAAMIGVAAVTGCSPSEKWTRPAFDLAAFRADDYACTRDTRMAGFDHVWAPMAGWNGFYVQCMTSKGYRMTKG